MFTGIVQEIGNLKQQVLGSNKYQLIIAGKKILNNASKGDSIAVNGVCLTIVDYSTNSFTADIMPETLNSTNLKNLQRGEGVNLEQAVQPDGFFGGHLVTGHVDCLGRINHITSNKNAKIIEVSADEKLTDYIVDKGSVALNGVSLTVVEVNKSSFSVSLIPETWNKTTFKNIKTGDEINIETDLLGKYVVKMMKKWRDNDNNKKNKIHKNFLKQNGFF